MRSWVGVVTALSFQQIDDGFLIFTDGATLTPGGEQAVAVVSKPVIIPHASAVIMARGGREIGDLLAEAIDEAQTFDRLLDRFPAAFGAALQRAAPWLELHAWAGLGGEVYLIGWSSSRDAWEAWLWEFDGQLHPGMAVDLRRLPPMWTAPMDETVAAQLAAKGIGPSLKDAESVDTIMAAHLEVMRALRDHEWPAADGSAPKRQIGGFCQCTILTKGNATSFIMEDWRV